jgi:Tol biopolymer transport system component
MLRNIKTSFIIAAHLISFTFAFLANHAALADQHNIKNNLLFLRHGDIWAFDVEKKTEHQLTFNKQITNYCASADARKLAYVKELKKLYVYDLATGIEEFIAEVATDASQPSFSPLADKIALISPSKKEFEVGFKIDTTTLSKELKAQVSNLTKPRKEKVRHAWIVDITTKSMVDITPDVPYQHSHVSWSPDGRRLSFASCRVGKDVFAGNKWRVYVMELSNPKHDATAVNDSGMSSVWLNNEEIVVSEGIATNTLSIYDIKTKIKKPYSAIRAGSSAPRFSLGGSHNEIIYYEESNPGGDNLIRSHNMLFDKTEDIVQNAGDPHYVK